MFDADLNKDLFFRVYRKSLNRSFAKNDYNWYDAFSTEASGAGGAGVFNFFFNQTSVCAFRVYA